MRIFYLILIIYLLSGCNKNILEWDAINININGRQGDAHLITKGHKAILIDAGQYYFAQSVLIPYLKKKHIKKLDAILITHPHFDHYGGVYPLIKSDIKINTIYMNMPTKKQMKKEWWGGQYKHLEMIRDEAKKHNIIVKEIKRGEVFKFDKDTYLKILYIYDGINTPVGKTDINDMSAIAMLYDKNIKILFTGDLNKKLGTYLAKNAKDIKADILKFPHHGAESFAPNSFFETVNPKTLIVPGPSNLWCSKRGNRARKLMYDNNYTTYINGFHGNISLISDGNRYKIKTQFNPKDICK